MNKNRCQICDGPIVNGRCKLCGMPYRNDEVLYHLNENRSDHYRHATPEARKELAKREVPLGDKPPQNRGNSAMAARNSGGRTYRNSYSPSKPKASAGTVPYRKPVTKETKKGNSAAIIITVLIFICALLPTGINYVKENYGFEISSFFGKKDLADYTAYGFLTKQDGKVRAGEWIPAGEYVAVIEDGYCSIQVDQGDSQDTISLTSKEPQKTIKLHMGDVISLHNVDVDEREVRLYLIKEYRD